ncbi:hypothetical protein Tco_0856589 [Tanacetum coccineum]|uniref:Uncharacterized protein n=1 Tax=Tanacetum coccineum TaxID=301880 RepID=A0ABQ5B6H3_9ASTR
MMESNDTKIPMDPSTKLVKVEDGNSVDATYYRSLIGSLSKQSDTSKEQRSMALYIRKKAAARLQVIATVVMESTPIKEKELPE